MDNLELLINQISLILIKKLDKLNDEFSNIAYITIYFKL
jgi:hypothetical protein